MLQAAVYIKFGEGAFLLFPAALGAATRGRYDAVLNRDVVSSA